MSIWWPMPHLWLWIDLENFINFFQSLFWKTISISSRAHLGHYINIFQSLSWKAQGLALAFMVRALTGGDSCYKVQLVTILQKIKCQEITMKFELWNEVSCQKKDNPTLKCPRHLPNSCLKVGHRPEGPTAPWQIPLGRAHKFIYLLLLILPYWVDPLSWWIISHVKILSVWQ